MSETTRPPAIRRARNRPQTEMPAPTRRENPLANAAVTTNVGVRAEEYRTTIDALRTEFNRREPATESPRRRDQFEEANLQVLREHRNSVTLHRALIEARLAANDQARREGITITHERWSHDEFAQHIRVDYYNDTGRVLATVITDEHIARRRDADTSVADTATGARISPTMPRVIATGRFAGAIFTGDMREDSDQIRLDREIANHPYPRELVSMIGTMRAEALRQASVSGQSITRVVVARHENHLNTNIFFYGTGSALAIVARGFADSVFSAMSEPMMPVTSAPQATDAVLERQIQYHPWSGTLRVVIEEERQLFARDCPDVVLSYIRAERSLNGETTRISFFNRDGTRVMRRNYTDAYFIARQNDVDASVPTPRPRTMQNQRDEEALIAELENRGCLITATGSRFMCEPPVLTTDRDYLVHVLPAVGNISDFLTSEGFTEEGSRGSAANGGRTEFVSWRRRTINLIVTYDAVYASKHRIATALCKRLNLLDKDDRIAVFRSILYDEEYGENYRLMTIAQQEARAVH